MKNVAIDEGLSIDRPASILSRLVAWTSATALVVGSPAMDAFEASTLMPRVPVTADPGLFQWHGETGTSVFLQSYGSAEATWRNAVREAEIALSVLRAFKGEIGMRELDEYLSEVDGVLGAMPERPAVDHARRFALGLSLARTKFIAEASTIRVWSRLARAIDPSTVRRRVPARFVRRAPASEEGSIGLTLADARVDRAVNDFLAPHADPARA